MRGRAANPPAGAPYAMRCEAAVIRLQEFRAEFGQPGTESRLGDR